MGDNVSSYLIHVFFVQITNFKAILTLSRNNKCGSWLKIFTFHIKMFCQKVKGPANLPPLTGCLYYCISYGSFLELHQMAGNLRARNKLRVWEGSARHQKQMLLVFL